MKIEDEFAEQAVGPGEPGVGEMRGIVLVEGFVHEAGADILTWPKLFADET